MLGLRFCECAGLRRGRLDLESSTIAVEESFVEAENGVLHSNRLGHADPALTLRVYAQATTAGDRLAAKVIDDHFAAVLAHPDVQG